MKAKVEIKLERDLTDDEEKFITDLTNFPKEILLKFDGVNFGKIKLDFEINTGVINTTRKEIQLMHVINDLSHYTFLLDNYLMLSLEWFTLLLDLSHPFYVFLSQLYFSREQTYQLYLNLFLKDEYIFKWIKTGGPISLCNRAIQTKLIEWLQDEETANTKINKLRDALLEHGALKSKRFKDGRPEVDVIKKLGTNWIKEVYKDFTSILKILKIKIKSGNLQNGKADELFYQASKESLISKKEEIEKSRDTKERQEKLKRLKKYLNGYDKYKEFNPILDCIIKDESLKTEFFNIKWYPNVFARKLLAKLLGVSESKIHKIVYSKK